LLCTIDIPNTCLCIENKRQTWAPLSFIDKTLSDRSDGLFFTSWTTSYFDHGDLSTLDKNLLEYQAPNLSSVPTIYKLSSNELKITLEGAAAKPELGWLGGERAPMVATYNRACFDQETHAHYPKMKVFALSCERTVGACIEGFWSLQRHDAAYGGGFISFESIPGANHFVRYDFYCIISFFSDASNLIGTLRRSQELFDCLRESSGMITNCFLYSVILRLDLS
jgi:hypothetical protein